MPFTVKTIILDEDGEQAKTVSTIVEALPDSPSEALAMIAGLYASIVVAVDLSPEKATVAIRRAIEIAARVAREKAGKPN